MKYLTLYIILLFANISYSQWVVSDPGLTTIVSEMNAALKLHTGVVEAKTAEQLSEMAKATEEHVKEVSLMKQVVDFYKKQDENFQKISFLKNLESYKKLYRLILAFACVAKDLEYTMQVADAHNDCLINFEYEAIIINFSIAQDVAMAISSAAVVMSEADRIKTIDDVVTSIEKAFNMANKLNQRMKLSIRKTVLNDMFYQGYRSYPRAGTYFNTSYY